jgi:hypothetical protein
MIGRHDQAFTNQASIKETVMAAQRPIEPYTAADTLDETDLVEPQPGPNLDPITGTRGSHPIGVGVGAATAGVVGGVIGSAVPVVGTAVGVAVGTAVGAVIGGYAGKGAAETLFPTEEEVYWREAHAERPYYDESNPFTFDQDYLAAYRFGYINSYAYGTLAFDDVEDQLRQTWDQSRDSSRLDWSHARDAARDAWHRARAGQSASERRGEQANDLRE